MAGKPYGLAVRAVIEDEDGRCLLLRRAKPHRYDGTWEWPGGKVDPGEDFATALRREVKEESNLEIELVGVVGAYGFEMEHAHIAVLVMEATVIGGELTLSEEHGDAMWVSLAALLSQDLTPGLRQMAETYVEMVQLRYI